MRIAGWILGLLVFNAVAFLVMLQLPPLAGILWVGFVGVVVAWWHLRPAPGRRRLLTLVRARRPRASRQWVLQAWGFSVLGVAGVTGLIHRFGYDFREADPGFWQQVADYQESLPGLMAVLLLATIIVPVLEELVFRGRIQRTLERRRAPRIAILGASLLFMIAHLGGPHWSLLLIPFTLGLAAGTAVYLTQSIVPGILIHAAWNALTALVAEAIIMLEELSQMLLVVVCIAAIAAATLAWQRLLAAAPPVLAARLRA